jgi:SAM-dependent methyltransferase
VAAAHDLVLRVVKAIAHGARAAHAQQHGVEHATQAEAPARLVPVHVVREPVAARVLDAFARGDALDASAFPSELDVIVSTGLGEFLDNDLLVRFYRNCHERLRVGGVFVTSGMQADRVADYLMRQLAELHTHYRRADELIRWLHTVGFHEVATRRDDVGLQTLVVARKQVRQRPAAMARSVL